MKKQGRVGPVRICQNCLASTVKVLQDEDMDILSPRPMARLSPNGNDPDASLCSWDGGMGLCDAEAFKE